MIGEKYLLLAEHYKKCYEKFGDNHKGADWPNKRDTLKRYKVMIEIISDTSKLNSILDIGCGTGNIYQFIIDNKMEYIDYTGLDINQSMIDKANSKFQNVKFFKRDILDKGIQDSYDYIIMNGLFTEKLNLTFDEMWDFFCKILSVAIKNCRVGIAFNLMSTNVDWQRDDLFHVPLDQLTNFIVNNLSRNYVIRNDYGLYEYTTYIYLKGKY